jgi:hypothetical protein
MQRGSNKKMKEMIIEMVQMTCENGRRKDDLEEKLENPLCMPPHQEAD